MRFFKDPFWRRKGDVENKTEKKLALEFFPMRIGSPICKFT